MGTMREELAAALAATGEKNASENRDRNTSMRAVANDIADAIEKGARIQFKASATCIQINSIPMEQRVPGDIYLATDAGVLVGEVPLAVQPNTAVLWDGRSWKTFLSLNLDNYYNKEQIDGAVNVLRLLIDGHATRTDNPHNVTAEQVGAISATALDEAIESEATARANADTDLGNRIDEEVSDRQQADIDLQSQIDSITSKSDVVDVVDSYSELLAYDTSELGDNDVVKVLEDETHDNAESYYRWNITTETWGYIGSQGPFVTPAEMQTALNGKVDKVTGKGLSTNDFDASAKSVTDNIFLATYGSTSYADIKAAYDSGKTILCRFTDSSHTVRVATFDRLTNSTTSTSYAYFASVTKTDAYELVASKTRYGTTTSWSNTQKTWGALAEKDSVTNGDISGTIQDAHIASASTWNGKADKVSNATNGHFAGLDANGNLTDSGVSPGDIASDIFIATYGTTTISQIAAAYNANKAMLVKMGGGNPGIALFTTRYTLNGVHSYWFYRKYGRDYGANEDQHYAYVYIDSSGWHDYSFTSPKKRHSSTTDEYGAGSESNYGHVQLTESVTQNSKKAVTSGAVYTALDGKAPKSHAVNSTTYGAGSETNYGHVQITNSVTQNSSKAVTSGAVYNALQNLPQPAPEIFVAEFGVTSYDEIREAVANGKTVICRFSNQSFSPFGSVYLYSLGRNDESYVFSFAALVGGYYITASVDDQSGTIWDFGWSKDLSSLLFNIDPSGSESNYVTERGTIKPIPPSAYPAITKDADYTEQTSTVVTLQQTNRLYKIHVKPSTYPFGDVYLHVSSGLTGVVFLDLKVGLNYGGCGSHTYRANYLTWTDIFGVEQKMRLYPDRYDGQQMSIITNEKTYFRLKVECYNGEIMAVTSFGDLHFEASGLVAKSVTSNKIATAAVTTDKIADGAVGTTELEDNAVTHDKIAFGAVSTDHQACGYFDWTIDSHYSGGSRNYIKLSGSDGGSGNDGGTNSLHTALANSSSSVRFSDVMIRFNVTYGTSSNIAYVYCNVESLPKFTLFKLKAVAVGHAIKIRFRTNGTTEALSLFVVNNVTGTNSARDYTIDANVKEDIVFFRGNDDNEKCTLYFISNWTV